MTRGVAAYSVIEDGFNEEMIGEPSKVGTIPTAIEVVWTVNGDDTRSINKDDALVNLETRTVMLHTVVSG